MNTLAQITVNLDEALATNKYSVDEENAHIELAEGFESEANRGDFLKLVKICPAALYKLSAEGRASFDYAGCLECGSCRILCENTIIKKWENPASTRGIECRYG